MGTDFPHLKGKARRFAKASTEAAHYRWVEQTKAKQKRASHTKLTDPGRIVPPHGSGPDNQ